MSSGDKLITLAVGAGPELDLEHFQKHCRGVIIRVASGYANKVLRVGDVKKNGFVAKRTTTHPGFVETFWGEMVGKLDIEIDDSVDNYVRRPSSDIVLFVKH